MPTKKSLATIFDRNYCLLQMKRHRYLALVPLGIFAGLILLCISLDVRISALMLVIVPYAFAIVPMTALVMYRSYAIKNEASHLHSLPLTREAIFISSYIAGLLLIVVPLTIMLSLVCIEGDFNLTMVFSAFALAVFYYTIASLGCILGGNLSTQLMMMCALAFGPVLVYLLINYCVHSASFGGVEWSLLDGKVLIWLCPIISAIDFMTFDTYMYLEWFDMNAPWPYWWVHLLIVIGIFALCIYLIKKRPMEFAGQSTVFKKTNEFLLQPLIFLAIVYATFSICTLVIFNGAYFNTELYVKLLALLVGTSLIVAIMMQIWFDTSVRKTMMQYLSKSCALTLLACAMFLIPLYFVERQDITKNEDGIVVSLDMPYGQNIFARKLFEKEDQQTINDIKAFIEDNSEHFVVRPPLDRWDSDIFYLRVMSDDYTQYRTYYFYAKDFNSKIGKYEGIVNLIKASREEYIKRLANEEDFFQDEYGNIYDGEKFVETVRSTFEDQPSEYYLTRITEGNEVPYYSNSFLTYITTFSSMNYEHWYDYVTSHCEPLLSDYEWQKVQDIIYGLEDFSLDDKEYSFDIPMDKLEFDGVNVYDADILSVQDKIVELRLIYSYLVDEDITIDDMEFFEGTIINIQTRVKVDLNQETATLVEVEGVSY